MFQSAQQIMEILQLLLILVVDVPVVRVMQILRCCRGEDLWFNTGYMLRQFTELSELFHTF